MKKQPYICPTCGVNHTDILQISQAFQRLQSAIEQHDVRTHVAKEALSEIVALIANKRTAHKQIRAK
ncbi:hypothetical protein QTH91_05920 [Variovorax dokdonensis]|uniref:DUF2752 domain-containing protein n=1 Tax=Variovorax dokdonensis TaxID=344883 RepID=A0ABT7N7T5_9BURK|nr:hypothetical protein [Variovorax dokdonensis]MDM0044011.1 hypothetical protein [Variovorax dokdonensis]